MKLILACLAVLTTTSSVIAQDPLAAHKIQGLEGLKEVTILTLPNNTNDLTTVRTLTDSLDIALARKLPELKRAKADDASAEWLVLSWIILPDRGATMDLSVKRWVRLQDSSKLFMATVWDQHGGLIVGKITTETLTDTVEGLVIRLAADYLRANPPQR